MYVLVFALVGAFTLWVSFAAPHNGGGGGHKTTGTITLKLPPDVDRNGDGLPNWGDYVSFNVSISATSNPFVNLLCYQNGAEVANGWQGYWDGALNWPNVSFGLSSPIWKSGAADCTAYIKYYVSAKRVVTDASTSFHVNP